MIYGLIPVGGMSRRLGIPFPKELLPLTGYDSYYPVCRLTVDNMISAGCDKIYFVHGTEYKPQIQQYFSNSFFVHINNNKSRQADVFSAFLENVSFGDADILLYGLPDTHYNQNLFLEMKDASGLVCGMYEPPHDSVVGRLNNLTGKFVKTEKTPAVSEHCWGVLKLDAMALNSFDVCLKSNLEYEVEELVNQIDFTLVYGESICDLGTWKSINKYWRKNQ